MIGLESDDLATKRMKFMKHIAVAGASLVVAAALVTGVGTTYAYFTTYAEAKGAQEISLGKTEITEDFSSWTKSVVITNQQAAGSSNSQPVFVRVKAFSGSTYPLQYICDSNWTPGGDGYYYYSPVLESGQSTSPLQVKITGVPEDPEQGDNFNVVVIYESTPVLYDESGQPKANWNIILDNTSLMQGGDN